VAYNMVAAACWLEHISNTLDLKTNKRLHEARQLLHVTIEQQTKSSASWCHAMPSRPSQPTTTINGDRSDAHHLPVAMSGGDSSSSSSDRP
jgi:hypothetical protein